MASLVPNGSDDNLSVSNTKTKGNTTHYDIDEHVSLDLKKLQETAKARMDATDLIIIVTPLYPVNSKSVFPRDRAPRVWGFDICTFGPK